MWGKSSYLTIVLLYKACSCFDQMNQSRSIGLYEIYLHVSIVYRSGDVKGG